MEATGSRSRFVLAAGAVTWGATALGRWWAGALWLAPVILVGLHRRAGRGLQLLAFLALVGLASGWASAAREAAVLAYPTPAGRFEAGVRLVTDVRRGTYGWWALGVVEPAEAGRPPAAPLLLVFERPPAAVAGERLAVEGWRRPRAARARGRPYTGLVEVDAHRSLPGSAPPWWYLGNLVRRRALDELAGPEPGRALLAGFLIGDTSGVAAADLEALRRTGLTHLVAVSGSNVALFLMLVMVAAGPLAAGPRRRAVVGLAALAVLVVATRWEGSVVRAATMAALMLGGRVGGWALDALTALGVTVVVVMVTNAHLATDVGFTLSVLATVGVVAGSRRLRPFPGRIGSALAATLGAQLAVAPIILTVFGSMPLLAPLTNLVAVPVVAASSVLGAVGVAAGWGLPIELATAGADLVLGVARLGAGWPQVGWVGTGLAVTALLPATRPRLRPLAALLVSVGVSGALLAGTARLQGPAAVVLDVGQGDSILIRSGSGRDLLVDGGPDPAVLEAKLAAYGVSALDLVVLTHVHADHAEGLAAVLGRRPVAALWLPDGPHSTPASVRVAGLAAAAGIPTSSPPVGEVLAWDDLVIEVLAPRRRYASPNDQSVVLRVGRPGGERLLLTGDVEVFAQADLWGTRAEILKVPHQGGATSDLEWLAGVGARLAVISVGPNQFGHPSAEVIASLEAGGAVVRRTDLEGDILVSLDGPRPGDGTGHVDGGRSPVETRSRVPRRAEGGRSIALLRGRHLRHGSDQRLPRVPESPHDRDHPRRSSRPGPGLSAVGMRPHRPRRPILSLREPHPGLGGGGGAGRAGGRGPGRRRLPGVDRHLEGPRRPLRPRGWGRHRQRHRWPQGPGHA